VVWLEQAVQKLMDRNWFWIDDKIEKLRPSIQYVGLPLDRRIQSSPLESIELLVIQATLTECV
jgi:hypothetical protein